MRKILTYVILLIVSTLCGCHSLGSSDNDDGSLVIGGDTIDSLRLCQTFDSLIALDHDTLFADKVAFQYYKDNHHLCWMTSKGIVPEADSLMAYISHVKDLGFEPSQFFVKDIAEDRERVDSLDFSEYDVYTVIARMDMMMTRAFLRYVGGQRYGFTNPYKLFNNLLKDKHDTVNVTYRQLYDIPTETIGKKEYLHLASMAGSDSVSIILQEAEPKSALYQRLKQMMATADGYKRQQIMVNMERCRWRHPHYPSDFEKYIVVNIPSYELLAVDNDSTLEMRIVCGSRDTKTPLLNSSIMRMDVNPQWSIPASVIKHELSHHAGDSSYFTRHRYVISDRKTGERYNPRHVSREMMERCLVRVTQEGGEGNALGRIIFRFSNNFSIFLHDTSSKGTFDRLDRRASHGCIRLQKPYELACFLLKDKDEELMDKIHYSMTYTRHKPKPVVEDGEEVVAENTKSDYDPSRIVHSVKVNPQIPLFITYYTLFLMPDGQIHSYPDVYDYDSVIMEKLNRLTKSRNNK